jgi:succinate dehydrogenase / fumarate reductase cytochrome b subunit
MILVHAAWTSEERMGKAVNLYQTSVGKKLVMALSGLLLVGFIIGHMLGNLKIFLGPDKFNSYAHYLREIGSHVLGHGGFLWIARVVLLVAVLAHIVTVIQLVLQSWRARDIGYKRNNDLSFSYASRTMRWGGVIVGLFIVYHLMHLTLGTVHPDFNPDSPYSNVVVAFRVWWVALTYAIAVTMLGFHIYHGLWSSTQTLGIRYPVVTRWRRPVSAGTAVAIVLGYLSVPLAVLAGWVG